MSKTAADPEMTERIHFVHALLINGVPVRPRRRARWLRIFLAALSHMAGVVVSELRAQHAARQLGRLDDATLHDIGVDRGQIGRVVRFGRRDPRDG